MLAWPCECQRTWEYRKKSFEYIYTNHIATQARVHLKLLYKFLLHIYGILVHRHCFINHKDSICFEHSRKKVLLATDSEKLIAALEASCWLWSSIPKGRLLTDRQLQGFDLFSLGRRFEYKYKYYQNRLHKWQTAYITLDMCHRQAFIEIQQVSFIKYRLILADL